MLAWAVAMGLVTWHEVATVRKPVPPGRYLAASGLFGLLALASEYQPASHAAAAIAWAFDLAVLLAPGTIPGTATAAQRRRTADTEE